ncbi:AraC family transcriptional regulator [Brevibacillus sp. H7]|uniref:AraC family transcriptional regulator n=1 Tax=Brevibacillus sp. H7 TaxID=3349138 RepID=UPI003801476E
MKFFELNLENSKLMMVQFAPKTADPKRHGHGMDYQLSIPLIGSPYIQFNHQTRRFHDKEWCITAPGEQHYHYSNENGSRLLLINFNQTFLEKVLMERLQEKIMLDINPWVEGSTEGFKKIADRVMKQSIESSLDFIELQELEYEMASLLFAQSKGAHSEAWLGLSPKKVHPSLKKALDYIHDDTSTELNLDTLAQVSGMSKYYLIRLFREYMGQTPSHYVQEIRLKKAEQFLRSSSYDVTDIAFEVGFGSLNTFERLFKKKFGINPAEYRKKCRTSRILGDFS